MQKKLMTKFSNKFKNLVFGPFWDKKDLLGKSGSVTHNVIWVFSTMPKFRKS